MIDKNKIKTVADRFRESGYGMVLACAFSEEEEFYTRCFSTVGKEDVAAILSRVSANCSQLPFDNAGTMVGALIADSSPEMSQMVEWGVETLEREEPMLLACVSEGQFSCYAIGDVPMLVYIGVKLLVSMGKFGRTLDLFEFSCN